ncbi:hypothetical protein [Paracoccus sp. (in: a-proteobacteria)]|uniref:hypothetical protein n=1 Tax=Paracoccus sp. TaxID=267 RepID=UPI003A8B6E67
MKHVAVALIALGLTAGAAAAANFDGLPDRSGPAAQPGQALETVEVRADSVMTATELHRAGLKPGDMITVTNFPSAERSALVYER